MRENEGTRLRITLAARRLGASRYYRSWILTSAWPLTAQTKDLRAVPINDADRASFEKSRKIALLVDVAEYPNYSQIGKLQYPPADVAAIGDLLRAQGYTVIR